MAGFGLFISGIYVIVGCIAANQLVPDLLQDIDVPLYTIAGGRTNISCRYQLPVTGLYSLKWYHNDTEFYRYVPTEVHRPVDIKPTIKFKVHEASRTESRVLLTLSSMTMSASGEYKCEVIAEHPSFRTESRSSFMTVLEETPSPPTITGARDSYSVGDVIRLKCQSESFRESGPAPLLVWLVKGHPARSEYVSPFRDFSYQRRPEILLEAKAGDLSSSEGGTVEVECVMTLGEVDFSRSKLNLKVTRRQSSYLSNYFSAADTVWPCPICWTSGPLFLFFVLRLY